MAERSVIGPLVTVVGTLESSGDVTIEGTVRGDITATGTVVVNENGKFLGNLYAKQATVRGHIEGSVQAHRVQLLSSCHVKGDIIHARIAIEDGAFFEGNCRHSENPLANAPKFEPRAKR